MRAAELWNEAAELASACMKVTGEHACARVKGGGGASQFMPCERLGIFVQYRIPPHAARFCSHHITAWHTACI